MATGDLEKKAKEAFVDDNFELAVDLYSQALDLDPKNADLYADRAQANIKLGNFTEAVSDANKAIELNNSMVKAYLRKGIASMKLEEYHTAKEALTVGLTLTPGDSRFTRLVKECDECIAEETNDPSNKALQLASQSTASLSDVIEQSTSNGQPKNEISHQDEAVQSKPKFRHDYYNTPKDLVLTIFAKGVSPENVHVEFGEQILSISIDIPGEDAFQFQPRLFGKIIPEKCKYIVLPSKIEIRLSKVEAIAWPSLEFKKDRAIPQKIITESGLKNQRPAYPSSSSKKKVEWDKLEAEVKKEEKDEKLEGDAALNKLFRDIYQNADEDMKRAMCKSFVESNGTVLSTNWKDIGSKKVEGSPPDGMEMKKWEY